MNDTILFTLYVYVSIEISTPRRNNRTWASGGVVDVVRGRRKENE